MFSLAKESTQCCSPDQTDECSSHGQWDAGQVEGQTGWGIRRKGETLMFKWQRKIGSGGGDEHSLGIFIQGLCHPFISTFNSQNEVRIVAVNWLLGAQQTHSASCWLTVSEGKPFLSIDSTTAATSLAETSWTRSQTSPSALHLARSLVHSSKWLFS